MTSITHHSIGNSSQVQSIGSVLPFIKFVLYHVTDNERLFHYARIELKKEAKEDLRLNQFNLELINNANGIQEYVGKVREKLRELREFKESVDKAVSDIKDKLTESTDYDSIIKVFDGFPAASMKLFDLLTKDSVVDSKSVPIELLESINDKLKLKLTSEHFAKQETAFEWIMKTLVNPPETDSPLIRNSRTAVHAYLRFLNNMKFNPKLYSSAIFELINNRIVVENNPVPLQLLFDLNLVLRLNLGEECFVDQKTALECVIQELDESSETDIEWLANMRVSVGNLLQLLSSVTHNPEKDGNEDFAKSISIPYYDLNSLKYMTRIDAEVNAGRTPINLSELRVDSRVIPLLNQLDGVIVRFRKEELKKTPTEGRDTFYATGPSLPNAIFSVVKHSNREIMYIMGSRNMHTTIMEYNERADQTKTEPTVLCPVGDELELTGINNFEYVADLKNVLHLLNIDRVIGNTQVVARPYAVGATNSVPDSTLTSSGESNYKGAMREYLKFSNKVAPRARGKLYAIFYHQSHPVAADENNIYVLDPVLYKTSDRHTIFRSDGNQSYLEDPYTMQALNYIFNLSKINITQFNANSIADAESLHQPHSFLTVAVIAPDCVGYDPNKAFNVKIVKSNVFPNIRLKEDLTNLSFTTSDTSEYGERNHSKFDDPIWPQHFSTTQSDGRRVFQSLEVFSSKLNSCTVYCSTMEYYLELLLGDSMKIDDVVAKLRNLESDPRLYHDGYEATIDDYKAFEYYVRTTFSSNIDFLQLLKNRPLRPITNHLALIKQRMHDMMYTAYYLIARNRSTEGKIFFSRFITQPDTPMSIPFERVEREKVVPEQMSEYNEEIRVTHVNGRNQTTFYGKSKMFSYTEMKDSARPQYEIMTSLDVKSLSRDIILDGDNAERFHRIIGWLHETTDSRRWSELNELPMDQEVPAIYNTSVNIPYLKELIAIRILNGIAPSINQSDFYRDIEVIKKRPANANITEFVAVRVKSDKYLTFATQLGNKKVIVTDSLGQKRDFEIDMFRKVTKPIVYQNVTRISTQYQHRVTPMNLTYFTLFMQKAGVPKKLMHQIYEAARDSNYSLALLGQHMNDAVVHVIQHARTVGVDKYMPLYHLLNTREAGTVVRNDTTIVHTIATSAHRSYYDTRDDIVFHAPKPEPVASAAVAATPVAAVAVRDEFDD